MTTDAAAASGTSTSGAGDALAPNVAECIEVAARYLATEPAAVQRVLTAHRRGCDGRCATCTRATPWPCTMAVIARRALVL